MDPISEQRATVVDRPVKIGKIMALSIVDIPAPVGEAFGALPAGGRLLSAEECELLAFRLEIFSLNPALPIWVYRVPQLDGFRFSERLDLAVGALVQVG